MSAERLRELDDETLGTTLAELDLRWPPAPSAEDLRAGVDAGNRPPPFLLPRLDRPSRRRTVLLIAAALLALAAAAGAARFVFDLGAVSIERIPDRPTAAPGPAFPGDLPGRAVSLEEASAVTGEPIRLPPSLGEPDAVWTLDASPELGGTGPWVGVAWRPADDVPAIDGTDWGAVFIRFRGPADVAVKRLFVGGADLRRVRLGGHDAIWVTGAHELHLLVDGSVRRFVVRGNVLLWQAEGSTFRLETALPLRKAIAIAEPIA